MRLLAKNEVNNIASELVQNSDHDIKPVEIIRRIATSCQVYLVDGQEYYHYDDIKLFWDNFEKAIESDDSSIILKKRGRKWRRVDVQEFAESKEYYNLGGHVWPKIMEDLWEFFHGKNDDGSDRYYIEGVFGGAIGTGKNFKADIALAYQIYDLSTYYDPQIEFGLAPGSSIIFIQQSRSLTLARKVVFDQFASRVARSPYFQKFFPFDPNVKSELRFPNNIYLYPSGGTDTSVLGMNVFGAVLDELNFMLRTTDSVHLQFTGEEEFDQAERLYTAIRRRITSRFAHHGKVPGKIILISSANYPDDFISRKVQEAKKDRSIFAAMHSQWDVQPKDRFSEETFAVQLGTETTQSRIIADTKEAEKLEEDGITILWVPIDLLSEFERDIEGALRDLAGEATGSHKPFIPYREQIEEAQNAFENFSVSGSLFTMEEVIFSDLFPEETSPDWNKLINEEYIKEFIVKGINYALHVDVGVSGDACGLAIGHLAGSKLIERMRYFDEERQDWIDKENIPAALHHIDGVLRIVAKYGGEVDINLVRDLVLQIHDKVGLKWVTADTYQSTALLQSARSKKIRSGPLSVDANIAPYAELKNAIKDERILFPRHTVLTRELAKLRRVVERGKVKVDHEKQGSKDVADAVAGVVYMIDRKEARGITTKSKHRHKGTLRHIRVKPVKRRRRGR